MAEETFADRLLVALQTVFISEEEKNRHITHVLAAATKEQAILSLKKSLSTFSSHYQRISPEKTKVWEEIAAQTSEDGGKPVGSSFFVWGEVPIKVEEGIRCHFLYTNGTIKALVVSEIVDGLLEKRNVDVHVSKTLPAIRRWSVISFIAPKRKGRYVLDIHQGAWKYPLRFDVYQPA